jgi:hypothetical protein
VSSPSERDSRAGEGSQAQNEAGTGKREPSAQVAASWAPEQARIVSESAIPVHQPTVDEIYESRLREIWAATHHGNSPPGPDSGDTGAWDLVLEAALGNTSLIGAAVAEQAMSRADTGLAGDARTVELLVGATAEQLPPESVPLFIRGTLAATVERLQRDIGRSEDVTRERIVDIVVRGLVPLRGSPRVAALIPILLGYLHGDRRPRRVGLYETVILLAQLMIGLDDPQSRLVRIFVYHYGLVGMWRVLQDENVPFDNASRQVLSVASGNTGTNLWPLLPERTAGAEGAQVVRVLRTILAAVTRDLPVVENRAAEILSALGLERAGPRAALTVLEELGTLGDPWTTDAVDVARIESASAVTALAAESAADQAPARFYNAAVSLQRAAEPLAAGPLRARMLLHALGLLWSLNLGTDLVDALDRVDGLDCAAGFMRALVQYQEEGHVQPQQWASVLALASMLAQVPKLMPRDRPTLAVSARNLADVAERVRLSGTATPANVDTRELSDATIRAVDALRPSGTSPQPHDPLLDTAALLHGVFAETLGQARFGLTDTINSLIELRSHPREEFLARYQRFAEPPESPVGTGPPVAVGVASQEEWEAITAIMLRDPGSIVPALQQV